MSPSTPSFPSCLLPNTIVQLGPGGFRQDFQLGEIWEYNLEEYFFFFHVNSVIMIY